MSKKGINLLKESSAPKTFWEKFYVWALSIGRFIIVGTEAIVLMVFLSRFKLDRDINDLTDSLSVKMAILESYKDTEADLREIQDTLAVISELRTTQETKADIFEHVTSLITEGTTVASLSVGVDTVSIEATSANFNAFQDFEESFKSSNRLTNVTIPSTESEEEGGETMYQFLLRANIKKEQI